VSQRVSTFKEEGEGREKMRRRENIEDDEWFLRDECDTRKVSIGIKIKKKKKKEKEAKSP
jgi:hypothetical protein